MINAPSKCNISSFSKISRHSRAVVFVANPQIIHLSKDNIPNACGYTLRIIASQAVETRQRDLKLWRFIGDRLSIIAKEDGISKTPVKDANKKTDGITAKDVTLTLNSFKRIGIRDEKLFSQLEPIIISNLSNFNLSDLSLGAFTYSYFGLGEKQFFEAIAERVVRICNERPESLAEEVAITWTNLAIAFARAEIGHRRLFEIVTAHLCDHARHIPGQHVASIVRALAIFGFKHKRLLDQFSKFISSYNLSLDDMKVIQECFKTFKHEDPVLDKLIKIRSAEII
eukprot:GHVL01031037.1.p1 GENE.GHVL01031037.1~~GHVL01031037.1.p1  ORF type:complete len:284 (+),score=34.31 GHVL01031037.1:1859-2710(+)